MNAGAFVAVFIAAQIAARQTRFIAVLKDAGALSTESAISIPFDSRDDENAFNDLVKKGRILEAGRGRYYLGAEPLASSRSTALKIACVIILAVLGALTIYLLASPSRNN